MLPVFNKGFVIDSADPYTSFCELEKQIESANKSMDSLRRSGLADYAQDLANKAIVPRRINHDWTEIRGGGNRARK
jgi:hypothetical protein